MFRGLIHTLWQLARQRGGLYVDAEAVLRRHAACVGPPPCAAIAAHIPVLAVVATAWHP